MTRAVISRSIVIYPIRSILRNFKTYSAVNFAKQHEFLIHSKKFKRLKQVQEEYQKSDKPVHLKAGLRDVILTNFVIGSSFLLMVYNLYYVLSDALGKRG